MDTSAWFVVYSLLSAGAILGSIVTFILYVKEIKAGHALLKLKARVGVVGPRPIPRAKKVKKIKEYDGSQL